MTVARKTRPQAAEGETREYGGMKKVAVLLLAVGPDVAGTLMKHMERETVEDLTREIASLGMIPPDVSDGVVEEFYNVALARQYAAEGGLGYARAVLERA